MDALNENRDDRPQISVNGVAGGAIHRVPEHPSMHCIAKDIYGAAKIDVRFDVSRSFRRFQALYQGSSHWNHFRHKSFSDSRRQQPPLSYNRPDQCLFLQKHLIILAHVGFQLTRQVAFPFASWPNEFLWGDTVAKDRFTQQIVASTEVPKECHFIDTGLSSDFSSSSALKTVTG